MTKNDDKRVPALRFKGFNDDWAQRKLGDVTQRVQGNNNDMNLPILTISAKNGWMTQVKRFSNIIAGAEKKKYTLLKKGELSYNHGNSKLAPFGTVFMLDSYSEALVPKVYHSFKTGKDIEPYFVELYFHTKKVDFQLRKYISSSARMDGLLNITYNWFKQIKIFVPKMNEQNKLKKIFLILNKYISLQQRKLKQYQLIKKWETVK
ncbi:restriction endonuclease subunit S [Lactobacillus crispatus]|uniref:restriction endonuclease subunit S n=1 Tax=Lactobacillus crispatus TaxID=47770 RepID=UPI001179EAC2|nr:restriction endonuclease subunit S [Lactobacillus crispatus]